MAEYKNKFTLDGRVTPVAGVTPAKVEAMRDLVSKVNRGNRMAAGTLVEALTTSDAAFNFAHLFNLSFIPQFDEAERNWRDIAGTRTVSDFRDAVLITLSREWDDGTLGDGDPRHVSPVIPEGTPYPEAYLRGETVEGARVRKRGFRTGLTFEAIINDVTGYVQALPGEMLRVALDTEEYEVFGTLINSLDTTNDLVGGTIPDGTVVPADSSLTRAALIQAIIELKNRQRNGRNIRTGDTFNLLVAPGQKIYADFILNNVALTGIDESPLTFAVNGYNPLSGVTVRETEYLTGPAWVLLPSKGNTDRPVLERLTLIGHEAPELRVENLTGSYVGGGAVSPFEGNFVADTAAFRLRQIGDGVVWSKDYIIHSAGTVTPTP